MVLASFDLATFTYQSIRTNAYKSDYLPTDIKDRSYYCIHYVFRYLLVLLQCPHVALVQRVHPLDKRRITVGARTAHRRAVAR